VIDNQFHKLFYIFISIFEGREIGFMAFWYFGVLEGFFLFKMLGWKINLTSLTIRGPLFIRGLF